MVATRVVGVWSPWPLHSDALVGALTSAGVPARPEERPESSPGVVVVDDIDPEHRDLVVARRCVGPTVVWGGTAGGAHIAQLRDLGAAAYVSMLAAPHELGSVVQRVDAGLEVAWTEGATQASPLSGRERDVAEAYLVRHAHARRAKVAKLLGISESTLKVHVANLRAKAGHEGTATREGLRRTRVLRGWISVGGGGD